MSDMTVSRTIHRQQSPYDSPWSRGTRLRMVLWEYCWLLFCAWTPKPLNRWRLFWLRLFGAGIHGRAFVHQRARIAIPWNLTMRNFACLGDRSNAYALGPIEIGEHATVAQEAYLCTGTHDFGDPALPLVTSPIRIGEGAFVGARAFVMPGVTVGEGAVIGACSLVTRDMPPRMICQGSPCRPIKERDEKRLQQAE